MNYVKEFERFFVHFRSKWKMRSSSTQWKSLLPPSQVFYTPFLPMKITTLDFPESILSKCSLTEKGGKKLVRGKKTFSFYWGWSHLSFARVFKAIQPLAKILDTKNHIFVPFKKVTFSVSWILKEELFSFQDLAQLT